jgi:DNA-binding NarL/FixJ family response regulator
VVKALCYSDQSLLAEGLRSLLSAGHQIQLCGEVRSPQSLLPEIQACAPDLLIVDWNPSLNWPLLAAACTLIPGRRVILLARHLAPELAFQARETGVAAVVDTCCALDELLETVNRVMAGELVYDQGLDDSLRISRTVRLTPREGDLVTLLSQGLKNKEIATCLNISEGTVKVYLSKLFQKVGAKDRFELALFGLKNLTNAEGSYAGEMPKKVALSERPPSPLSLRSIVVRPSVVMGNLAYSRAAGR